MGFFADQGDIGGGSSVGLAHGRITIDTQSLAQQRAVVIREARLMGDQLKGQIGGGADAGVKQAESALGRLNATLTRVSRSISVTLGAITAAGVASAQSVKSLEARFRLLVGSEKEAVEQLDMLREMADKTGQPFLAVVEGATAIIPALRGTNGQLDDTLSLVQRLAILDPAQGVAGSAFAIREFLNGEYLSLVRRLELDRKRVRAIIAEADGDTQKQIELLSAYIDEMGLTEEAMIEMGQSGVNSFRILRDEGTQTLAQFFEPFLNDVLIPTTRALSDMLRELRHLSPELQKFLGITAGLASTAALAQTGLPLIGQVPGGGTIAKAGVLGAAGYAGVQGGAFLARQTNLGGTGEMTQGQVLAQVGETFKQALGILIIGFSNGVKVWIDIVYQLEEPVNTLKGYLTDLADGIQKVIDKTDELTPNVTEKSESLASDITQGIVTSDIGRSILSGLLGAPGRTYAAPIPPSVAPLPGQPVPDNAMVAGPTGALEPFRLASEHLEAMGDSASEASAGLEDQKSAADEAKEAVDEYTISLLETLGIVDEGVSLHEKYIGMLDRVNNAIQDAIDQNVPPDTDLHVTDELLDAWEELQTDLTELEATYQEETEQELADHEERKADLIASYQERVLDILDNAQVQYERALQRASDKEAAIRQDMIKTIAESDEELAETLAELNTKHREEEQRAVRDHLRRLKGIRAAGEEALLRAAANFDGRAIWEAQRTMQQRIENEQESYQDEREERRKRYEEALDDAIEAHDDQIDAAREAADEQITLLWDRFNREEQLRQEDTRRQLVKLQRDHQQRLAELDREHRERLADLASQYGKERSGLLTHFAQTLLEENQHLGNLRAIEAEHRKKLEDDLRAWWEENGYLYLPPAPITAGGGGGGVGFGTGQGYQHGGRIRRTGMFLGHAGEHVINAANTRTLSRMLGGTLTQRGLVSAVAGQGGDTFTLSPNINVYGTGMDQNFIRQIEDAVSDKMMDVAQGIIAMRGKASAA